MDILDCVTSQTNRKKIEFQMSYMPKITNHEE